MPYQAPKAGKTLAKANDRLAATRIELRILDMRAKRDPSYKTEMKADRARWGEIASNHLTATRENVTELTEDSGTEESNEFGRSAARFLTSFMEEDEEQTTTTTT